MQPKRAILHFFGVRALIVGKGREKGVFGVLRRLSVFS